jgi:hypothetical protein
MELPAGGLERRIALVMAACTALFSLRVLGQAIQRWYPTSALPEFHAWQGSTISYGALLVIQIVILALMTRATVAAWRGTLLASHAAAKWAAILGGLYMAAAMARIAIGLWVEGAPSWFTSRISGAFHVVLATFVLALAGYHLVNERAHEGAIQ